MIKRYQKGNQNPYIEEGQAMQWSKDTKDSDYPFGKFWSLYCLSFLDIRILITLLVNFGHYIACPFSIYEFWLPFRYLLVIILLVLSRYTDSDYSFGIFWERTSNIMAKRYQKGNQNSYIEKGQAIQWPKYTKGVIRIRISRKDKQYLVIPRYTGSDYIFGIFCSLYCLSFLDIRILVTPLVSFGHCIACPSSIYGFWLESVYQRYQRGSQNPYIKDIKGVVRICISKIPKG
jgi:hypothetical protein